MKKNILIAITAIIILAAIIIGVSKCTEPKPIIDNSSTVELLKQRISEDSLQIIGYNGLNKALQETIKQADMETIKERRIRAVIEEKYNQELARVQALPDDSAVGLFLDNADCGELEILKYDSLYLIPICPIRSYNELTVGYEYLLETNQSLTKENTNITQEVTNLKQVIQNDSVIFKDYESIIKGYSHIDKVCADENQRLKRQLRKQKFRTGVAWGTAAVITYGLIWIGIAN